MKKVLSILLATVMLLGTVNFTVFASEENWADVADTSWYNDADTSFTLDSAEKLAGLAELVNGGTSFSGKTILLGSDIDLENKAWEPIGSNTTPFQGKFEGGNHTISNLKVEGAYKYAGFFGYVKSASMTDLENPTIQNLTIEDAYIDTTEYNAAGALSGQIFVGTVKNVHATGTVKGGAKFAGGLVGHVYTSFDNCSFEGNVSSANQSGGIAGSGDGRVYNSYVKGDVNAAYWAGGIIGNGQEGTSIVNCYVEGDVSASNCWYYGVGGLAGVAGHGYTGAKIENNYFNGTVYLAGEKINTPVIGFVNASSNDTINSEVGGNSWNTDNYPADLEVIVTAEVEQSGTAAEYKDKAVAAEIQSRNNKLVMLESDLEHIDTINPEEVTIMTFSEVTEEAVEEAAEANVVAKIGDVGYATLEDAIKSAAPSGTVDIVSDITIEKWTMFAQNLTIGNGQIITLDMNDLTINGNGHSITVESIESARNGNYLFSEAENLNINDLTINIAEGVAGGISLVSGTIDNVTFNGGNGVFPGAGEVTINECTFNTANHAIYYESARDNLTVTNNTFDVGADKNVILLRGNETFTDNNIISGRTVNAVSGSPTISGNTFAEGVRLKVYNDCTATISNNTLTYIVFEDGATTSNATFAGNILNDEAREALESVGLAVVAKIGDAEYCSLHDAATDASNNDIIILLADGVSLEDADAATLTGKSVTIDLNEKELTINSATDYSDLISIPKNYKVDRTAVTDSVYTYSLKKVVIASPVGVVGGSGSSVSKPSTPSQDKTDEETKEDTKLDEDAKTDESDANKEDSTTSNTEKTTNNIVLTIGDANINVFGNTIKNDVAPKLVNDRTMLPARLIAESLGATVTWTAAEPNKVLIEKGDKVIIITIGSDIATVNGEEIKLDSPAFIENDRTYIPTRFLSEKLGATVEWVPVTTQVIITVTE